jgi:radical SAM superfamily enzyme YgiQ (UPF0313 family)
MDSTRKQHKRPQRRPDHFHRGQSRPRPAQEAAPGAKEKYLIPRPAGGNISCCLIFPNTYHLGMSNLGFQTVYGLLNSIKDVYCERAFLPASLLAERVAQKGESIQTVESRRGIQEFQFIGFSLSFELDLPNVLRVLSTGGIPLESALREDRHPFVFGGGALTLLNPEPIADFMDFLILGEAEETLREVFESVGGLSDRSRASLLKALAAVPGVYVPSIHGPARKPDRHRRGEGASVTGGGAQNPPLHRRVMCELSFPTHSVILTPDTEFSNSFLLEISRGCPHMCNFCMVCHSYTPYRWRRREDLLPSIELGLAHTNRFGLVGADLSTYPHIENLLDLLEERGVVPSFSSLRAQALSPRIVKTLVAAKQETLTLAPETSERLRLKINKRFSDEILLRAAERVMDAGIRHLRLYYMLGLPGEEDEDIAEIVGVVQQIAQMQEKRGPSGSTITLNFNQFVPKAHTPFERRPFAQSREVDDRLNRIRNGIKRLRNVQLRHESTRLSWLQALIALGDRNMAKVLRRIYLDTSFSSVKKALKEEIPGEDRFLFENRQNRLLPWSHLVTPQQACPRENPLDGLGFKPVRRDQPPAAEGAAEPAASPGAGE